MNVDEIAAQLPKVELHLHLDGSLSKGFIGGRASARGIQLPDEQDIEGWLQRQKTASLAKNPSNKVKSQNNWPVFDFCNQFLQTRDELTSATADLLGRLADRNVWYAEVRFCPSLHTLEGLTEDQAVQAVIDGVRAKSEVIAAGVILCALRSKGAEHGVAVARLAKKHLQVNDPSSPRGVVGFDVAGDEGSYPLHDDTDHAMAAGVAEALKLGVPVTLHAGEWPEIVTENAGGGVTTIPSVENLRYAATRARRIGHGIALRSAPPDLQRVIQESGVTFEVCLTSNVARGFKVPSYSAHPVKTMWQNRIPFTLSMDNWMLSGDEANRPSPEGEICHLVRDVIGHMEEGLEAVRFSLQCGLEAAFTPLDDEFKRKFMARVDQVIKGDMGK